MNRRLAAAFQRRRMNLLCTVCFVCFVRPASRHCSRVSLVRFRISFRLCIRVVVRQQFAHLPLSHSIHSCPNCKTRQPISSSDVGRLRKRKDFPDKQAFPSSRKESKYSAEPSRGTRLRPLGIEMKRGQPLISRSFYLTPILDLTPIPNFLLIFDKKKIRDGGQIEDGGQIWEDSGRGMSRNRTYW